MDRTDERRTSNDLRLDSDGLGASLDVEQAVRARYAEAAQSLEPALCCPMKHDTALLAAIPDEVIERDYGCGDPSAHLHEGACSSTRSTGRCGAEGGLSSPTSSRTRTCPSSSSRTRSCGAGASREDRFLQAFEDAGFYGIRVLERDETPWRTVEGLEFRSVTVVAWKGKEGPCLEGNHAVIYRGPFREVTDDDGHVLRRGDRMAVCEKTYALYAGEAYGGQFDLVPPRVPVAPEDRRPFPCNTEAPRRDPRETKGLDYRESSGACGTDGGACC